MKRKLKITNAQAKSLLPKYLHETYSTKDILVDAANRDGCDVQEVDCVESGKAEYVAVYRLVAVRRR
jgi:hypothetical protein